MSDYPSCPKDASRDSATSRRDCQTRIENVMLRGDIPPELEDEILLKIEGVIESQLNRRKRREMMVVVKDSLDKALRHATRSTHTNHDSLPTESPRADHTSKARSSVDPGATSDSSNSSALFNLQTAQISIGTGKDSRESGEHSSTVVVRNDLDAANQNMVERDRRYLGSQ